MFKNVEQLFENGVNKEIIDSRNKFKLIILKNLQIIYDKYKK